MLEFARGHGRTGRDGEQGDRRPPLLRALLARQYADDTMGVRSAPLLRLSLERQHPEGRQLDGVLLAGG